MAWNRDTVRTVIFEAHTPAGKAFDLGLIVAILVSVLAVMLDSVGWVQDRFGGWLYAVEWLFTIAFTIEYGLRLWSIQHPALYARSFYGIIDLLCILPTYVSFLFAGTQYLLVIRVLRVLRVFRVLRMVRYVGEAQLLADALRASSRKITVFVCSVLALVIVFGSFMYLIEGPEHGFTSIPKSIYWSVITLTTVGYGDLVPLTPLGQAMATVVMIMGYGIIAIPTGIVTMELSEASRRAANTRVCPHCAAEGHVPEAIYCWRCGETLHAGTEPRRIELGEGL